MLPVGRIPWARKIVDDTLIWAKDMEELVNRTRIILDRCRKNNITISRKKLELGKRIHFAGHIISDEGIQPDEEKYSAISKLPRPRSVKYLRSFLGLAQELWQCWTAGESSFLTEQLQP